MFHSLLIILLSFWYLFFEYSLSAKSVSGFNGSPQKTRKRHAHPSMRTAVELRESSAKCQQIRCFGELRLIFILCIPGRFGPDWSSAGVGVPTGCLQTKNGLENEDIFLHASVYTPMKVVITNKVIHLQSSAMLPLSCGDGVWNQLWLSIHSLFQSYWASGIRRRGVEEDQRVNKVSRTCSGLQRPHRGGPVRRTSNLTPIDKSCQDLNRELVKYHRRNSNPCGNKVTTQRTAPPPLSMVRHEMAHIGWVCG